MNRTILFLGLFTLLENNLSAQIYFTANENVIPYSSPFCFGANMGAYFPWKDEQLANIAAGNPAMGVEGVGVNALRPLLSEWFLEYWGYDIRLDAFKHYEMLGARDNVVIVGYPSPDHQDTTHYCNSGPSELFANLYLPIWDNGENGTPVNDDNYYALYLWKMVSQYHPYVKFWEIWNEPDFDFVGGSSIQPGEPGNWWEYNPNPCSYALRAPVFHYIRMLRISYEVIKTIAPDDYVAIGGIGYPSFLDVVLRNTDNPADGSVNSEYPMKGGAYFDVLSFHSYPHIDNSLREWDNSILGFKYFRHSDRCVDGLINRQAKLRAVLEKYGYDGATYPEKLWIVTESNIPRVAFDEYIGSPEAQRNYVMKALVTSQQNDICQFDIYQLGEIEPAHSATNEFQLMGLFTALDSVAPYKQKPTELGIAFKTTSSLLKERKYDAAQTAKMDLPAGIRGGAFRDAEGKFTYVLWAATNKDKSEAANAVYSFPASFHLQNLHKREWNFSTLSITSLVNAGSVQLTGTPVFLTDSESEKPETQAKRIYLDCNPNPFGADLDIRLTLPEPMLSSLALYDVNGRVTHSIFTEKNLAEGEHQVLIDSSDVPPGTYFLRFWTYGDRQVTCKVVKN